jgi:hypothetical protein
VSTFATGRAPHFGGLPFVFAAQRAPAHPLTSGPSPAAKRRPRAHFAARRAPVPLSKSDPTTSSAKRRARVHRTAHQMAAKRYSTQPPADGPPPDPWSSLDPPPKEVYVPRDTLGRLFSDPRHDLSTWPDIRPTSPSWAPWDPSPAYVPVPLEVLRRLRLDSPCPSPPQHSPSDAAGHNDDPSPAPERSPEVGGRASSPYVLTDQDAAILLSPGAEMPCAPQRNASPSPRRTRSPGPLPRTRPHDEPPPPPPAGLASSRPGWPSAQPNHVPAGHGGDNTAFPGNGWQAERTSILQAITALAYTKGAQWDAEHAEFLEEAIRLRQEISDSYNSPPGDADVRRAADNHARAQALHSTASLLASNRKSYRDALVRAILDLDAADTPALAAAAINAARSFLVDPAPVCPTLSRPESSPTAHPPLPLQGYPAAIVSGHLLLPDPRIPRAEARSPSRMDQHARAPTTNDPGRHPLARHPLPPLRPSTTPTNSGDTPLPRRELGGRRPAPLPEPDTLRWAGRHRSCASIRPSPAKPDLISRHLPTPDTCPTTTPRSGSGLLGAVDHNRPPWRRLILDARPLADEGPPLPLPPPFQRHQPAPWHRVGVMAHHCAGLAFCARPVAHSCKKTKLSVSYQPSTLSSTRLR